MRPLAFKIDPETVHERAMWALRRGLFKARQVEDPRLSQTYFGRTFPNPLGLAAGFDKNAIALDYWHQLGFGFVECGTITSLAQPGNPRPRMFRLPQDKGLINRLGFNNDGARAVATRLAESASKVPIGVNLGKSKLTELADAPKDYEDSFRLLHGFGDYFVVNVSSPNTPGLRELQDRKPLQEIISGLKGVDDTRPILIKIAPDLEWEAIDQIVELCEENRLAGIVATNTSLSRINLVEKIDEAGGLSGAPLKDRSNQILKYLHRNCPADFVLIGVGGIFTGDDLYEKIALGAHLCQLYTGWIYGGPMMIPEALERLLALMDQDGIKSLAELRGSHT